MVLVCLDFVGHPVRLIKPQLYRCGSAHVCRRCCDPVTFTPGDDSGSVRNDCAGIKQILDELCIFGHIRLCIRWNGCCLDRIAGRIVHPHIGTI